jgi:hypothetical protein
MVSIFQASLPFSTIDTLSISEILMQLNPKEEKLKLQRSPLLDRKSSPGLLYNDEVRTAPFDSICTL